MGARDDWSRCKDWTVEERAVFDAKIARSRQPWSTWQRFYTQANVLFHHGRAPDAREEAARLLERSLVEVRGLEPEWAADSLACLAEIALATGDLAQARARIEDAARRCPARPQRGDLRERIDELRAQIIGAAR